MRCSSAAARTGSGPNRRPTGTAAGETTDGWRRRRIVVDVKFLLAQFAMYALAAFVIGVVVGVLWQRRPVRLATDRLRRAERAKLSVDDRLAQSEVDLQRATAALAASQDLSRVVAGLRSELVEVSAAGQAAVAARHASESQIAQLRADLDRRIVPSYATISAGDLQRRHSADVAELRAEHQRELDRRAAERAEQLGESAIAMALLQERLSSTERHLLALQRRHNDHLRTTQTALTAAVVRAEQAEALVSALPRHRTGADTSSAVIDLRPVINATANATANANVTANADSGSAA